MIEVKKLVKIFSIKSVLHEINFHITAGEFVILLGPNGAGKSTFIRILASLMKPTSGEVRVAGYQLPRQATYARSQLGVVTHQPLLYDDLTAEENLRFHGRLFAIENENKRVSEILELVGLTKRRRDLVRTYSRGMQQRLSIGRAILHDPKVVLFDEPHTGLDQEACNILDNILREISSRGRTVLISSHDIYRIASLGSRYDVLLKGRLVASKKSTELHGNLLNYYKQALENN